MAANFFMIAVYMIILKLLLLIHWHQLILIYATPSEPVYFGRILKLSYQCDFLNISLDFIRGSTATKFYYFLILMSLVSVQNWIIMWLQNFRPSWKKSSKGTTQIVSKVELIRTVFMHILTISGQMYIYLKPTGWSVSRSVVVTLTGLEFFLPWALATHWK
jgi:hypothetical protein